MLSAEIFQRMDGSFMPAA